MADIGITGIIPATYYWGLSDRIGSTYVRVDPIAKPGSGFEKWIHGKKYDNIIFQQFFWKGMMSIFEGPKILDISDPDWLKMSLDIAEMHDLVDAITCSSEELAGLVRGYFPEKKIVNVPDRLDFSIFPSPRAPHKGKARKAYWFGYIHNAHEVLEQLIPSVLECGLELSIISDYPYSEEDGILALGPNHIKYDRSTVYTDLKDADILLNPRSDKAFFRYKSNNKSLMGWQLGIPVAVTNEDVMRLMDPVERNREIYEKQQMIAAEYDIKLSIEQYRQIFMEIKSH